MRSPVHAVRPRTGHISFLNCFPLIRALERSGALAHMEISPGTPGTVADLLVRGRSTSDRSRSSSTSVMPRTSSSCRGWRSAVTARSCRAPS
ncbi:hypothetical protein HFP72_19600 [Nocardiopsis sp. ARC36]